LINLDYQNYPERPIIMLPGELGNLIADPYEELETLRLWNPEKPNHVIEVLRELEKKLSFIGKVELESKKIHGE
jgi:hypothetical protein